MIDYILYFDGSIVAHLLADHVRSRLGGHGLLSQRVA